MGDNMLEILEKYERRRDIEDDTINRLSEKFKDLISEEELISRIKGNGFSGLYILNDDDYDEALDEISVEEQKKEGKDILGFYNSEKNVIILKDSAFEIDNTIVEHEFMHAYFGKNLRAVFEYNGTLISYGIGYEEAIASIVQSCTDLDNIENIVSCYYMYPVRVFKQLDILYRYLGNNKYKNLLYLAVKEPENFMNTVLNIYSDIMERVKENSSLNKQDIDTISYKTALDITTCIDDFDFVFYEQPIFTEELNSLYFSLLLGFNYDKKYEENFSKLEKFTAKTEEELLLSAIFGSCEFNPNNRISKINALLNFGTCLNDDISAYQKKKTM